MSAPNPSAVPPPPPPPPPLPDPNAAHPSPIHPRPPPPPPPFPHPFPSRPHSPSTTAAAMSLGALAAAASLAAATDAAAAAVAAYPPPPPYLPHGFLPPHLQQQQQQQHHHSHPHLHPHQKGPTPVAPAPPSDPLPNPHVPPQPPQLPKPKQRRYRATPDQLRHLIARFEVNPSPSTAELQDLATTINMPPQSAILWFKNRRARVPHKKHIDKADAAPPPPPPMPLQPPPLPPPPPPPPLHHPISTTQTKQQQSHDHFNHSSESHEPVMTAANSSINPADAGTTLSNTPLSSANNEFASKQNAEARSASPANPHDLEQQAQPQQRQTHALTSTSNPTAALTHKATDNLLDDAPTGTAGAQGDSGTDADPDSQRRAGTNITNAAASSPSPSPPHRVRPEMVKPFDPTLASRLSAANDTPRRPRVVVPPTPRLLQQRRYAIGERVEVLETGMGICRAWYTATVVAHTTPHGLSLGESAASAMNNSPTPSTRNEPYGTAMSSPSSSTSLPTQHQQQQPQTSNSGTGSASTTTTTVTGTVARNDREADSRDAPGDPSGGGESGSDSSSPEGAGQRSGKDGHSDPTDEGNDEKGGSLGKKQREGGTNNDDEKDGLSEGVQAVANGQSDIATMDCDDDDSACTPQRHPIAAVREGVPTAAAPLCGSSTPPEPKVGYLVQYVHRQDPATGDAVLEEVMASRMRPEPPGEDGRREEWRPEVGEAVEVLRDGAWFVAVIQSFIVRKGYMVSFESGDVIWVRRDTLRPYQIWRGGSSWVTKTKPPLPVVRKSVGLSVTHPPGGKRKRTSGHESGTGLGSESGVGPTMGASGNMMGAGPLTSGDRLQGAGVGNNGLNGRRSTRGSRDGRSRRSKRARNMVIDNSGPDGLPEGWRMDYMKRSGFVGGRAQTFYIAPDGHRLKSLKEAQRYVKMMGPV